MRHHPAQATLILDPPQEWGRRRLQLLLAVTVMVATGLIAGAGWAVLELLHPRPAADSTITAARHDADAVPEEMSDGHPGEVSGSGAADPAPAAGSARTRQDELAARPLPSASLEEALPGPLSTASAGSIRLPAPTRLGPANVATGFPHTPAGAMAQLIAIDQAALTPASVPLAQAVITAWAEPGGPTPASWSVTRAVATLLTAAALPANGTGTSHTADQAGITNPASAIGLQVTPAMGFIKGQLGPDFVIPCVDLLITTGTASEAREPRSAATADCQRMVWRNDRWLIGAGTEPAPAPSLWPGTQASFDAGYQWLETAR
jgi:hypothetical protein